MSVLDYLAKIGPDNPCGYLACQTCYPAVKEEKCVPEEREPLYQDDPSGYDETQTLAIHVFNELECTEPVTLEFIKIALADIKLFDKKQHDYGSENISAFGEQGVLVRANDKIARLRNLAKSGSDPANESIDDSWTDLSVYGIIARLVRKGVWR